MMRARVINLGMGALAVAALVACSDGLTTDQASQTAAARVTVQMQQVAGAAAAQAVGTIALAEGGAAARITADDVGSLVVTVTDIQFLPVVDESMNGMAEDPMWQSIGVEPFELDFTALPGDGESALTVASGEIAEGDYRKARLFTSDAFVTFTRDITVGQTTLAAVDDMDQPVQHPVRIPSARNTGIKTDFALSVNGDTDVLLLFDPAATFKNVTVTGNGQVIMSPVVRAKP